MPEPASDPRRTRISVLLDYDNVPPNFRQRGLPDLLERIMSLLPRAALPHGAFVACRLYGGWYEARTLSPRAQKLLGEIRSTFPLVLRLPSRDRVRVITVDADLARSLLIRPTQEIFHTFRRRGVPRHLASRPLPFAGCQRPRQCPLAPVHDLLSRDQCPEDACAVRSADVFMVPAQKLVDTMLTTDLIQDTRSPAAHTAIVTSDDDIWPGIYMALNQGATVHHICPAPSTQAWPYASSLRDRYFSYDLPPSIP